MEDDDPSMLFPNLEGDIQDIIREAYERGFRTGEQRRQYATIGAFIVGLLAGASGLAVLAFIL